MTTSHPDQSDGSSRVQATATDSTRTRARTATVASTIYRPSSLLREILRRSTRRRKATATLVGESSSQPRLTATEPRLLPFLGVAFLVSVASGFLEVAALGIQGLLRQRIGWHSLMTSRHITWMVPVTAPLVIVPLAVIMVCPVIGLLAWRRRRARPVSPVVAQWVWGWAGTVLGTLLLLGPILATHAFHRAAAAALAVGIGFRLWHGLVRPIAHWRRLFYLSAGIVILALPPFLYSQWKAVAAAPTAVGFSSVAAPSNLLWIVLDTVSAEHMSLYNYQRRTTPELEEWAKEGIAFETAHSAAPWTLPSHVTMFTGLWPFEHEARVDRAYSGRAPTLAEYLRTHGYQTAGIAANVRMCNAAYGVGRGFDHYVDYPGNTEISLRAMMDNSALGSVAMEWSRQFSLPVGQPTPLALKRTAREITGEGRAWLDGLSHNGKKGRSESVRPFFLFLNLMDAHDPYLPCPEAPRRFWSGPIPSKKLASPACGWNALKARDAAPREQREERERELEDVRRRLTDLYDECLYGLDFELGRFLCELRDAGKLENTWVVITADHGEHFGEHNRYGHGSSLYNEQTHVPLILLPPFGSAANGAEKTASLRGRRIAAPVSLRDLPKTFAELLIPGSDNPFPGRSLARHWNSNGSVATDPVLSQLESPRLTGEDFATDQSVSINSLIDDGFNLIDSAGNPPELYAIGDRKQQRNLAESPSERSRLETLRTTLSTVRRVPRPL